MNKFKFVYWANKILPILLCCATIYLVLNKNLSLTDSFTISHIIIFILGLGLILKEEELNRYKFYPIIIVLFLIFVFYSAYSPNFQATWYIVDDHKVPEFQLLIQKNNRGFIDLLCNGTYGGFDALCTLGKNERYHPTAQIIHFMKLYFFGMNHLLWFVEKFLVVLFSLFLFQRLVSKFTGQILALLFTIYLFSEKYFSHFFVMHMPSETYGVLAFSICAYCGYKLLQDNLSNWEHKFYWIILGLATILGMGMKENFIIFIAPIFLLFMYDLKRKKLNSISIFFMIFSLLMLCVIIFAVIVPLLHSGGRDTYARDTSANARFPMLITGFDKIKLEWELLAGISVFGIIISFFKDSDFNFKKSTIIYILLQGFLLLNYIFQFVFYNGEIPLAIRYDFPGITSVSIFWLVNMIYLLEVIKTLELNNKYLLYIKVGFSIALLVFVIKNPFTYLTEASENNRARTRFFMEGIDRVVQQTKEHPDWPIAFESYSWVDYEPMISSEAFLLYYGVKNPMSVRVHGYEAGKGTTELEKVISAAIHTCSKGGCGYGLKPAFKESETNCYSIFYMNPNGKSNCINLGRVY